MEIPIIILNWNGWEDTQECMSALLNQTFQNFHVYLVDNGSQDGSQKFLNDLYGKHPKIKLILNDENLGFTKGNNEVFRKYILPNTNYQFVVLLNNDTVPSKDWLNNLVQSAIKNRADIVSSKMIDYYEPDKMDNAGHLMLNTGEVLPIGHGESVDKYVTGFENMGACAGAAIYSTNMLKDIGIFDEHFSTGYEDAELGIRAVVAGYKCWFEPNAIVKHKMGQSIKKIFDYEYSLSIQKHILYSYFKITPLPNFILSFPSLALKFFLIFIVEVLFWRPELLNIMIRSIIGTLMDRKKILMERRIFFNSRNTITMRGLSQKQTYFLRFYFKRFQKIFLEKEPSSIEKYGKVNWSKKSGHENKLNLCSEDK